MLEGNRHVDNRVLEEKINYELNQIKLLVQDIMALQAQTMTSINFISEKFTRSWDNVKSIEQKLDSHTMILERLISDRRSEIRTKIAPFHLQSDEYKSGTMRAMREDETD